MSQELDADVIIIGSGFGGVSMALEIQRRALGSYLILERAESLGGTWRDNTYPGAACDVPASLYRYSFAPHSWSRRYPPHHEILAYLIDVATTRGVSEHILFSQTVTTLSWNDRGRCWDVTTADGTLRRARYVVDAIGQLSRPATADIAGRDDFAGPSFHTARWDHSVDLTDKRVAIVGTGASAIQVAPAIADRVASLTIFQRSAPYVLEKNDPTNSARRRWTQKWLPGLQKPARLRSFILGEVFAAGIVGNLKLRATFTGGWQKYRDEVITDSELRRATTPDYALGCKRVLFSSEWYPTLNKPHVELVTTPIEKLDARGVLLRDGRHLDVDVVVWATGFETASFTGDLEITGREGQGLKDLWGARPFAHRGVSVPQFPNFFFLYGPNTNLGSNSIIYMLETQSSYIGSLLRAFRDQGGAPREIDADVAAEFVASMDRASEKSSWMSSCSSWYTHGGINTNNWPGSTSSYRRLLRQVDVENYRAIQ